MAANKYGSGEVPLGDNRYVTDAPKKGYIYLCRLMQDGGGAQVNGPWIHGISWNIFNKLSVQGAVTWSNAEFSNTVADNTRILSGNGLPSGHTTGNFPIERSDPVYAFDRNPNSIRPQTLRDALPLDPLYSDQPSCMGGEAGIMLTGVPIFNGFDAGMRDAPAHEAQDSCQGHPQQSGQYHYHSLSSCMKDIGEKTVIGYALDGFPITGPLVAPGRYLTTENLDECHGITSEIVEDGQKKTTYHYVMTQDFPYSVSCFRGKPVRTGPSNRQNMGPSPQNGLNGNPGGGPGGGMPGGMQNGMMPPPQGPQQLGQQRQIPSEAFSACGSEGSPCGFNSPRGDRITGICRTPPGLRQPVCIPSR